MYFLPISLALFVIFLVLLPVLFVLAPAVAFAKLGLPPLLGYVFFIVCLLGGGVNIPVYRERVEQSMETEELTRLFRRYFGIRLPERIRERVVAVNLGGAVLPSILCVYLLTLTPLWAVAVSTSITSVAAYLLSRPVKGVGVVMPAFVPPIIAALAAVVLAREHAPQVAYISGVMGTLLGADIVRIPRFKELEAPFLSIGGAGVFDGIYLVGLVSVLLA
ncbi:MAG: DUF1614 domain-containing protein [Nitrospirota bacterium]